jgi:hypothetical protein
MGKLFPNFQRENSACSTNQKALIRRTLYLNPWRNFLSKELDSVNLAVNQNVISEQRRYHPFGHFWITVCKLTCLPWYDFVGREFIRYLDNVCTKYSPWVRQAQKVGRNERNELGANKRSQIRTRTDYHKHADCPNDVARQGSGVGWRQCGYRTISKTLPRPKNRMVQEAATKISDRSVCGFEQLCKHFLISMCFMDAIYCFLTVCKYNGEDGRQIYNWDI